MKRSATKRKIPFNITIEDAWRLFEEQNNKCAISGVPICFDDRSASLDRIDNKRGYEIGNLWWVHKDINIMKNVHGLDYFITMCEKVSDHQNRSQMRYNFVEALDWS